MSISARQRLTGLAANGDIASTNYARDYEGTIVGEEVVDGEPTWMQNARSGLSYPMPRAEVATTAFSWL